MKSCWLRHGIFAKKVALYEMSEHQITVYEKGKCSSFMKDEMSASFEEEYVIMRIKKAKTELYLPIEHVLPIEQKPLAKIEQIPYFPEGIQCYMDVD